MVRWLARAGFLVLLLPGPWGCDVPDRPPGLPSNLPEPYLDLLEPDSVREFRAAPGLWVRVIRSGRGPWVVHMLEMDLRRCDLSLTLLPAGDPPPGADGRARVSELAEARADVVAAVNGDFFTPEGRPIGWEVLNGRILSRGPRPVLAWVPGEMPWMGRPTPRGGEARLGPWTAGAGGSTEGVSAVGGFPVLLADSGVVGDLGVEDRPAFADRRHPRTAVGVDRNRMRLWILVVDGRQEGYSDGMTLPELAGLLLTLGVTDAINLDGGGSSVMVVRGQRISRPSDAEGERAVGNALAVAFDPERCP